MCVEGKMGSRWARKLADPRLPTAEESDERSTHHITFRPWCAHCIRGQGKDTPHLQQQNLPNVLELHLEFMFMGDEGCG